MREILFRGKRIDNGAWVYGDLIWADYIPARAWISSPDDGNRLRRIDTGSKTAEWRGIEVDPKTVGQYTGLTDKNGQKIFEGDIVAFADSLDHKMYLESLDAPNGHYDEPHNEGRSVAKIIYGIADDYPAFDLDEHDFEINGLSALANYGYWYEVIGNIHDNPELLEVGE